MKSKQSPHTSEQAIKQPNWLLWSILILGCVILVFLSFFGLQLWIVWSFVHIDDSTVPLGKMTALGLSGDLFGFSNAVFSACAFAMIIVTLWMQKFELEQQREELGYTRDVLEQQQAEMRAQNESLQRQTFEHTFFGMLELLNRIAVEIRAQDGHTSRKAFTHFVNTLPRTMDYYVGSNTVPTKQEPVTVRTYEEWYRGEEAQLGPYFRTLYNILRYIDEAGGDQKKTYARLVRAQLSKDELKLLFYNGLSTYGREKCKALLEKFAILKHLYGDPDIDVVGHDYTPAAFGRE